MYARTKVFFNRDGKKRTYLQIVEGFREGGKSRQRVIANLGRLEELQDGALDNLIASLAKFSHNKWGKEKVFSQEEDE